MDQALAFVLQSVAIYSASPFLQCIFELDSDTSSACLEASSHYQVEGPLLRATVAYNHRIMGQRLMRDGVVFFLLNYSSEFLNFKTKAYYTLRKVGGGLDAIGHGWGFGILRSFRPNHYSVRINSGQITGALKTAVKNFFPVSHTHGFPQDAAPGRSSFRLLSDPLII
ncbi:hypothetical protein JTE90_012698 [Oedothorax gibbosus]|uniref:Uncharacterized protein n=1 Tax=Oedothorax gibbosus TaxID=931172 RepID=A0AAV6VZU6_9ARAC|nr:hypothetical protein JTE90_012698 [Oedothorax gibbosus]